MPPKSSQSKARPKQKVNTLKFVGSQEGPPLKKFKPLSAIAFDVSGPSQENVKGKGKAKIKPPLLPPVNRVYDAQDDRLWVDIYEPTTEAELAVHKRKVEDVRRWLHEAFEGGPSGKLKKYRRVLALTGPAGIGKTTTIRVLARELGFEILEWRNGVDGRFSSEDSESLAQKFQAFVTRASSCPSLFPSTPSSSYSSSSSSIIRPTRRIILLEDLPNILHLPTQQSFHTTLQSHLSSPPGVPLVIIVSDAGIRGEDVGEGERNNGRKEIVDVRSVLGELMGVVGVTTIVFNPIAPTILKKALQSLLSTRLSSFMSLPKSILDNIVETSNGDIRSAIMGLQFTCSSMLDKGKKAKGKAGKKGEVDAGKMIALTNREQSLHLFHLLGKVLYNKRKNDPPNPSATAKDIAKEKELDSKIKDPLKLPRWLETEKRRGSRVLVDALYADSPIDSSLFGLYLQQNYPQFCDRVEECQGVAEWLSWVDWSGGEDWHQANPHRFHLLTLGTLHSLPSPVARRGQKFLKPEWFDVQRKERESWDGVSDTRNWLVGLGKGEDRCRPGWWSKAEVATELGGVLNARDAQGSWSRAPGTHTLFSSLEFKRDGGHGGVQLAEGEEGEDMDVDAEDEVGVMRERTPRETGGWLEHDDIEEF